MTKKRLTEDEKEILEQEFQKNPNWGKVTIRKLAERLDLDRTKIYKWNWDRKKMELSNKS